MSAFVLTPAMGWSLADVRDLEETAGGLRLASRPEARRPLVDEDGTVGGYDLPTGVAADAAGRLYVADVSAHVIKRYDPACPPEARVEILPCLGGDGPGVRNLRRPAGLAIRGDDLFVVDAGNARVLAISLSRMTLRLVVGPLTEAAKPGRAGEPGTWQPWDVAVDSRGHLYVSDRRGRIFHLSSRGRLLAVLPLPGAGEGPVRLAVASPPRLTTRARPVSGEVLLRDPARRGATEAGLERDAWHFVMSGDLVEFRAPADVERRTVVVREDVLAWSPALQGDYSPPASTLRVLTAIRAGDAAPVVRVESPRGWRPGDWLRVEAAEFARVREVRTDALVLERSSATASWQEGARLARVTPVLAVADARPGVPALRLLDADGNVLVTAASVSDLLVLATHGGLAFGGDLPGPLASPSACERPPVSLPPEHLEAALDATLHRTFRLLPPPVFAAHGSALIGPLDSGRYRCQWDAILADVAVPEGTRVGVETLTADAPLPVEEAATREAEWQPARLDGDFPNAPRTAGRELWSGERDTLVQSGPGQYLYLRIALSGSGAVTSTVRSLRITFPRESFLRFLPAVYQEDAESRRFLDRFLRIFQASFDGFGRELDAFARYLDPRGVPEDFLPWLGSWLGLPLDWPWPAAERVARQRALLARAPELYRRRGTPAGLRLAIAAYTGLPQDAVQIVEGYCARKWLWLSREGGRGAMVAGTCLFDRLQLGSAPGLGEAALDTSGDPALDPFAVYAHRFTVVVPASYAGNPAHRAALEDLIERERPAHAEPTLYAVTPRLRVGIQSIVGVDTLIGTYPETELGKGQLGLDTVLTCPQPSGGEIGRTTRIGGSLVVA